MRALEGWIPASLPRDRIAVHAAPEACPHPFERCITRRIGRLTTSSPAICEHPSTPAHAPTHPLPGATISESTGSSGGVSGAGHVPSAPPDLLERSPPAATARAGSSPRFDQTLMRFIPSPTRPNHALCECLSPGTRCFAVLRVPGPRPASCQHSRMAGNIVACAPFAASQAVSSCAELVDRAGPVTDHSVTSNSLSPVQSGRRTPSSRARRRGSPSSTISRTALALPPWSCYRSSIDDPATLRAPPPCGALTRSLANRSAPTRDQPQFSRRDWRESASSADNSSPCRSCPHFTPTTFDPAQELDMRPIALPCGRRAQHSRRRPPLPALSLPLELLHRQQQCLVTVRSAAPAGVPPPGSRRPTDCCARDHPCGSASRLPLEPRA